MGMMADHSLHVSIVDGLIIVLIIVGRSLAKLIGLPISASTDSSSSSLRMMIISQKDYDCLIKL